jgi:sigma-B regulation protein RsbU (phosphoserine phosphatase)
VLTLFNAGLPRPVLVRDGKVAELKVEGLPLGMFADVRHEPLRVDLRPGDVVVAFSDGVCESIDQQREEFGARKMQALLVGEADRPAQELADGSETSVCGPAPGVPSAPGGVSCGKT